MSDNKYPIFLTMDGWHDEDGTLIPVVEECRASTWETSPAEIEVLESFMHKAYTNQGLKAAIIGVMDKSKVRYAVFVEAGVLVEVKED